MLVVGLSRLVSTCIINHRAASPPHTFILHPLTATDPRYIGGIHKGGFIITGLIGNFDLNPPYWGAADQPEERGVGRVPLVGGGLKVFHDILDTFDG